MSFSDFMVVIPARYGSTRLPGKPLRPLAGKPLIEHVWQRAQESGASEVIVATDDERIVAAVRSFGGEAMMTSSAHQSGTDRLAEVASRCGWQARTIVVNLQGDEPMMPGRLVARIARALHDNAEAGIATLAAPIRDISELFDPNVVKVVLDQRGFALYFSRAPIPWVRDSFGREPAQLPSGVPLLRHFGLYGYRVDCLERLARASAAPLETAEALEQLRALAIGTRILVDITDESLGRGVDTLADLELVEALMAGAVRA